MKGTRYKIISTVHEHFENQQVSHTPPPKLTLSVGHGGYILRYPSSLPEWLSMIYFVRIALHFGFTLVDLCFIACCALWFSSNLIFLQHPSTWLDYLFKHILTNLSTLTYSPNNIPFSLIPKQQRRGFACRKHANAVACTCADIKKHSGDVTHDALGHSHCASWC